MKTNLTKIIACAIIMSTCFSCTVESVDNNVINPELNSADLTLADPCSGNNPRARLTNNGSINFDLEILTLDGILLNHEYNITPGSSTSWLHFVPGEVIFSVTNNSIEDEKLVYEMLTCMEFDMEIDVDNQLTDAEPIQL
jgi:hypothetical protein